MTPTPDSTETPAPSHTLAELEDMPYDDLNLPADLQPRDPSIAYRRVAPHPRAIAGFGFASAPKPLVRKRGHGPASRRTPHLIDAQLGHLTIDLTPVMTERGVVTRGMKRYEGYPNLSALERGTGLSHQTVFVLLRHPESIQFVSTDTVARVCEFLHCQPGDFMRYTPLR